MSSNKPPSEKVRSQQNLVHTAAITEVPLDTLQRKRQKKRPRRFAKVVSVYLTPGDFEDIAVRAEAQHDSVSRFARRRLLNRHKDGLDGRLQSQVLNRLDHAFSTARQLLFDTQPGSSMSNSLEAMLESLTEIRNVIRGLSKKGTPPQGSN